MARKRSSSIGAVLFMAGAVVFSGLAGVLLSRLLARQYPQEALQPLVVAGRDIEAGRPLEAADLRQARWPQSSVPRGSFVSTERVLELGAVSLVSLVKGEAVLATHLSRPRSGLGVAAKLEPGQRAMAFRSDASVTLAQLLYPGARVDLLTTMRRPGSMRSEDVKTKVLLQDVRVLAVGPDIDPASAYRRRSAKARQQQLSSLGSSSTERGERRVVTVAVTTEQAERVVLASREGKIDIVLRGPRDDTLVRTAGATPAEILAEDSDQDPSAAGRPAPATEEGRAQPPQPRSSRRRSAPRRVPARRRSESAPAQPGQPSEPTIYRGGGGR